MRATGRRCTCTSSSSTSTPDGRAHALLYGQQVVGDPRRRDDREVYLGHTGYRVRPGTGCGCTSRSSDFPLFLPHPGTAENPWDATTTQTNRQTLATGGATPSHVSLTVVAGR